jgi:hypothetical protein
MTGAAIEPIELIVDGFLLRPPRIAEAPDVLHLARDPDVRALSAWALTSLRLNRIVLTHATENVNAFDIAFDGRITANRR